MSKYSNLNPKVVIESRKGSMAAEIGDEPVILHPTTGRYYGLNSVGTRIWQCIQSPIACADLIDKLHLEYDVPRETLEQDVLALLDELKAVQLIHTDRQHRSAT